MLLTTKFEGVNLQILSRIAEKLAKTATTEEQATTAIEGVTFQNLIDSQSDYRANEATVNAVSNYEKKHGLKDGQKAVVVVPTETDQSGVIGTPAWAKTLIDSSKTLTERIEAIKGAKITDSRKLRFDAIIANLPEGQKKAYQRTPIDSLKDEAFEALVIDVKAEVGVIEAREKARESVFNRPLGGGYSSDKSGPTAKELDDAVNQLNLE